MRANERQTPGSPSNLPLTVKPLTDECWPAFEELFGDSGGYSGCWCMWWRLTRREFEENGNPGNRDAMRQVVGSGTVPGLLAYEGDIPVGWCSVAPREDFGSLERSRVLKRVDDVPCWSIVCFFVARSHRGRGVIDQLIEGAADWARGNGATILEAYPGRPRGKRLGSESSFMGLPHVFLRHGFEEVARPSDAKTVMRRAL